MRTPLRLALLLLLPLLAGCVNPFKPATPERPTTGEVVLENFDLPDSVLATMSRAMAAKTAGATAYADALSDAFLATTPDDVRALFAFAPVSWSKTNERNYLFPSLVGLRDANYEMRFWRDNTLGADDDNQANGQVVYQRYYAVWAVNEIDATNDTIAFGIATLTMQKSDSRWALTQWTDRYHPDVGPNTDPLSMGWRRLNALPR